MVLASRTACAQWLVHTTTDNISPGRVVLLYSPESNGSFPNVSAALKHTESSGKLQRLDQVTLTRLLWSPSFQSEIFSCLRNSAPEKLDAALRSSGNLNNPHMVALAKALPKALQCTPTVRQISSEFSPFGLRLGNISVEKVSFVNHGEQRALLFSFGAAVYQSPMRPNNSFKPKPLRGSA